MRKLTELIDHSDPAWPIVSEWIATAERPVEVLSASQESRDRALLATQVTTRSPMGAIVHNSAAILIDHGWLRILGAGGHPRFQRSLPSWNEEKERGYLLIADDILGGFFAINGGTLGNDLRMIYYYAPDTLGWESCDIGYSDFVCWAMSARMTDFYADYYWPGWEKDMDSITGDQALSVFPFLFTEGPHISKRTRGIVPVEELWNLQNEIQHGLDSDTQTDVKH
jgi:hypothetical protein